MHRCFFGFRVSAYAGQVGEKSRKGGKGRFCLQSDARGGAGRLQARGVSAAGARTDTDTRTMSFAVSRSSEVSPLHALARSRALRASGTREEGVASEEDACVCDESPDEEAPAMRKRVLAFRGVMVLACAALSLAALRGGYADAAGEEENDDPRL